MDQNEHGMAVEPGSGNVFADLDLPNPEERQMKSLLAMQIRDLIEQQNLSQAEAARTLGLEPDEMALLWRGRLSGFSIGQLIKYLNHLGVDVKVRAAA